MMIHQQGRLVQKKKKKKKKMLKGFSKTKFSTFKLKFPNQINSALIQPKVNRKKKSLLYTNLFFHPSLIITPLLDTNTHTH